MVEGAHARQTQLIHIPVQTYDWLLSYLLLVEELGAAHHTDGQVVLVLEGSVGGVVVLIEVHVAITSKRAEQVTILRQVPHAPNSRFMCQFRKASVTTLRVISLQVEDVEFTFEGSHNEFVHVDVGSVELQPTNTVLQISVPSQAVRLQVKEFDITVVVTSREAPLIRVVAVTEAYSPAVWLNWLVVARLQANHR